MNSSSSILNSCPLLRVFQFCNDLRFAEQYEFIFIDLEFLSSIIWQQHFISFLQRHRNSSAILFECPGTNCCDYALWYFVSLCRFREIEAARALLGSLEFFDQNSVHQWFDAARQQRHSYRCEIGRL